MKKLITLAAGLLALFAAPAMAGDTGHWFFKGGVTQLTLEKKLDLTVGGGAVPGAQLSVKPHLTPSIIVGRYVSPHWAVSATLGLPPHIKGYGAGTIAPYGKLLETTYGPMALTMQYHPVQTGVVRPYVGAGAAIMLIFSTKDGSVANTKLTNDVAPVIEGGIDFACNDKHGFYIDLKKGLLETKATGTLMGFPVVGKAKIHPLVASAGYIFKF